MKKINFSSDVLPHGIAVVAFLIVTVFFFKPYFLDNMALNQHDITQATGASKVIQDYRDETGKEALWAPNMFSGMPAYLISVDWSDGPVKTLQSILSLGISHPVRNIFLGLISYYILLLAFRVRPYLAITGALAFAYSSYILVGLAAGHNARIGAIAFMPLVVAGIHMVFQGHKKAGFAVTAAGMALHLRENHLQMTYYLLMIVAVYGIIQLVFFLKEGKGVEYAKNILVLIPAMVIALGTFFGQLWAINEYTNYSIRSKSEIAKDSTGNGGGLPDWYAFEFSNGLMEPMTLMIPDIYGGASSDYLVQDQESHTYQALVNANNRQLVNQLAQASSAYWGPQRLAVPYYGGAIICFLFVLGILFAEKKYVWWLVSISVLAIMMSWGDNFKAFNYFLFNHLPIYNKFRSPTFALIITLFAMPLLGLLGLENIIEHGLDKKRKKKVLTAFLVTGGICFLFVLFGGAMSFVSDAESSLPGWFTGALRADRRSLLIHDSLRSIAYIGIVFLMIYLELYKRINTSVFYLVLALITFIDIASVDTRYFTQDNYERQHPAMAITPTAAERTVMSDTSYYRIYNISVDTWSDATTSYFGNSIGGYHGAKIKRYQDLYDSCLQKQTQAFLQKAQEGKIDFESAGSINMLNVKYMIYGPDRGNLLYNQDAPGPAWFAQNVQMVKSPLAELQTTCAVDPTKTAVIDQSKFEIPVMQYDSTSTIVLTDHKPNYLRYESNSSVSSLAVFSEIYYPKGWHATIDGTENPILRANYVLRAMVVPAGKHVIEFRFEPRAYYVGNKVTAASSWVLILVVMGALGWSLKREA